MYLIYHLYCTYSGFQALLASPSMALSSAAESDPRDRSESTSRRTSSSLRVAASLSAASCLLADFSSSMFTLFSVKANRTMTKNDDFVFNDLFLIIFADQFVNLSNGKLGLDFAFTISPPPPPQKKKKKTEKADFLSFIIYF